MENISERTKRQIERLSLHDQVDLIHLRLVEGEHYVQYLEALYDEEAVEGSLVMDYAVAAIKIRDAAPEHFYKVKKAKLANIVKSLKVVLRRYGASRQERREVVGDNFVMTNVGERASVP